jgi:hypothetical protein
LASVSSRIHSGICQLPLLGVPGFGGVDWCEYDYFSASAYALMLPCTSLPGDQVNACFRTAVYGGAPECTSI